MAIAQAQFDALRAELEELRSLLTQSLESGNDAGMRADTALELLEHLEVELEPTLDELDEIAEAESFDDFDSSGD